MILDDILQAKKKEIDALPLNFLKQAVKNVLPAKKFLAGGGGFFVIAEIKKASPSRGIFREDFDPVWLARQFEVGGAAALSVVTERDFFKGHLDYIRRVKAEMTLPVLRKDFIIAEAQIYESRVAGADAILLIAQLLDEATLCKFVEITKALGMECVVEVHEARDVPKALKSGAMVIGINNRDLKSFQVDVRNTLGLLKQCPELKAKTIISESGVKSKAEIEVLKANGVAGVLVGESLIKAADPAAALKALL
jgi:indole-3-glycerol phosphate synthase